MRILDILNVIAHLLHGFLAGLLTLNYFYISLFLYVQFFAYEYVEETKIEDEMYKELKQWSIGYIFGLTTTIIIRAVKHV